MKAKTPLSDPDAEGHTADANDPNKVNYTQGNETQKKIGISSGTVLLDAGQYVFTSIHITLKVSLLLSTITPLAHARIWNCATV